MSWADKGSSDALDRKLRAVARRSAEEQKDSPGVPDELVAPILEASGRDGLGLEASVMIARLVAGAFSGPAETKMASGTTWTGRTSQCLCVCGATGSNKSGLMSSVTSVFDEVSNIMEQLFPCYRYDYNEEKKTRSIILVQDTPRLGPRESRRLLGEGLENAACWLPSLPVASNAASVEAFELDLVKQPNVQLLVDELEAFFKHVCAPPSGTSMSRGMRHAHARRAAPLEASVGNTRGLAAAIGGAARFCIVLGPLLGKGRYKSGQMR